MFLAETTAFGGHGGFQRVIHAVWCGATRFERVAVSDAARDRETSLLGYHVDCGWETGLSIFKRHGLVTCTKVS